MGERLHRPGRAGDVPDSWSLAAAPDLENSWGFVLFPRGAHGQALYCAGKVPPALLARFAHRKAFIFLLEAVAQVLPLWALWPFLQEPYWSFVDNTAAQHCLIRGSSSNTAGNHLAALFWAAAARARAAPWFERVSSEDNLSDGISRQDFALAQSCGWRRLDFDFGPTFELLVSSFEAGRFDIRLDVESILADLGAQRVRLGLPAGIL
eukprot:4322628-Heterocapsa_arctica.AAC.1